MAPAKPQTPRPNSKSNVPFLGRQSSKKTPTSKTPGKPNTSILSFFKKVDNPIKDESIFLSQGAQELNGPVRPKPSPELSDNEFDDSYDGVEFGRYNEAGGSVKRRKTSREEKLISVEEGPYEENLGIRCEEDIRAHKEKETCTPPLPEHTQVKSKKAMRAKRRGPFLSDSDSDYEGDSKRARDITLVAEKRDLRTRIAKQPGQMNGVVETKSVDQQMIIENKPVIPDVESVVPALPQACKRVPVAAAQAKWEAMQPKIRALSSNTSSIVEVGKKSPKSLLNENHPVEPILPLKKEETIDDWTKFDATDQFPDDGDEFADGEEFVERKWMEEQARLEAMEEDGSGLPDANGFKDAEDPLKGEFTAACPICGASLEGISADDAAKHVNGCLDGNPVQLPKLAKQIPQREPIEPQEVKRMPECARNRFAIKAGTARPGQANPFEFGRSTASEKGSAFSKLMFGHAEDAAWTTAAATENASRGKPAYKRTCPFYKIMPGFFICVDAFRYGAVQGCNAYFLSHFHSDHYVGLTSSWCHGLIYCSKATANLVRQQLRVDPKWVVALEFEAKFEIPGTQGVDITMIPANHCPGSSLFLFEKIIGKGNNPKMQRVLHCGDFRACPAHIAHPLLMSDVVDTISGKTKKQKIDVCYLDTTYLNPRYAFPSQEDVVKACADMCVLEKERAEESDSWETAKRERAGSSMAKFVNSASIKAEDDIIAMAIGDSKSPKPRGRLLVICGTYSIGKERICMGIARVLDCKIWAPPGKMRICAALEDPELMSRMTDDPIEAQIHMQMLMEIRAETLQEYLNSYKPHFSRVVGFRPSGWNYRPPNSRITDSPSVSTIINSPNWKSTYSFQDLVPQRGSTREVSCFGVPYSEHSSFRELTLFVCSLRIKKVVPTVNIGSAPARAKMKAWIERWLAERRKNGCLKIGDGEGEVRW
ncbi:DNA repair metallo-beta-lactamase-domain-containing protein [Amylocarpus encephaloides]|uniref:DNA repair metallo-beta-lactamase-domain-containing protein n=1 Tax=Amylocarpus encephaloides TaxID=45428 RepID=A0A9P7YEK3_9HELO|nr:DNA repair metallo-beta-lactamase-domain-containing protein [Amylocarpus encephaloides]